MRDPRNETIVLLWIWIFICVMALLLVFSNVVINRMVDSGARASCIEQGYNTGVYDRGYVYCSDGPDWLQE